MAIQSNMNLLGVDYSDANDLWRKSVEQLATAGDKTRKEVNINQEKMDNNVLGFVNQLANKHGVNTPEFEQGMQQVLAQNPNNNLDMGTILANATKSRGDILGLQKAGLENQITQGGINDAQTINSVAPLLTKRNRTPQEEATVQQALGGLEVTNLLEPMLKTRQLDDNYKLKGLEASLGGYASGARGAGVQYDQPQSQLTGPKAEMDILAAYANPGFGGGGTSGTSGGTGGLFTSAPTAQTQTSGNAGGARVPDAYARYVNQSSQIHGVNPSLVAAVMKTESSFKPNETSSAGAQGLMQLMPGTAKDMGVQDSWDPAQNIEGGTKYLGSLLKRYNGNTEHALMAYNWGMGHVDKYLEGKATPPKETVDYVQKVAANLGGGVSSNQTANTPSAVSQWDANVSGKALQSRLKIKQNESVANGSVAKPTAQFAEIVQNQLGDNLKYFSAFNDTYHAGSNSKHAKGTAFDVVLKDGVSKQEAAVVSRNLQQVAAASGFKVKILDEYNNPSENSTGGHLHVTVEGQSNPGDPLSAEGYMGGLSLDDALGMLGPAQERPANIAPDESAFNLIMDQLGLEKDDPIVDMYKQFVGLGADRGKQVADYQQSYMDYNQSRQDRNNLENYYTKSLVSNKIKVDTQIQKELQDQAKLEQVRSTFSGGLVGFFGESRAKEFVDYIKSYRELSKEEFYAATPDEQITLMKDWAQQQQGFDKQSAKSENRRSRDGALTFNEVAVQSDKLLDKMAAARVGTDPSMGDFKVERTKVSTANSALKNVLTDIKDNKDRKLYDSIDSSITPKALETILTESIKEYEAAALGTKADSGKIQSLLSGTVGFKGNGTLSDTEFGKLQNIVRTKLIDSAKGYDDQLASALKDSVAGEQAGSDLKSVLDALSQLKSNL